MYIGKRGRERHACESKAGFSLGNTAVYRPAVGAAGLTVYQYLYREGREKKEWGFIKARIRIQSDPHMIFVTDYSYYYSHLLANYYGYVFKICYDHKRSIL